MASADEERSLDGLETLEAVGDYVGRSYSQVFGKPSILQSMGLAKLDRLPALVAEPGRLMAHAVMIAGEDGLTRKQLRTLFDRLGADRLDRGEADMRSSGLVAVTSEPRLNAAGRSQEQVVFRWVA